ncbi:MAG: sulfatase-like hydrolase/transferase [Nitrospiraceae bacterium]|nr:sulfatase-like hydrolase/transferase [Nitrospiraceae bacterium]
MRRTTRREFLGNIGAGVVGATAAGLLGSGTVRAQTDTKRPPNIVFILIDDLGWADVGCYGNTFNETPHIDALAKQGVRFTSAYAACPVCSPTRASILSGQYPARIGITDFIPGHYRPYAQLEVPVNRQQYMPLETVTIAEALKTAGYTTGMFGKWHLGGMEYFPDKQGFDAMLVTGGRHFKFDTHPDIELDEDAYLAETLTEYAEAFIEANQDKSFFLYLSHYAVHIPLEARQALIEKYEAKKKPATGVNNPIYAAMVEHVDDSVGQIMTKLRELDLEENTMVVFMSDNGGLYRRFDEAGPAVTSNAPLRDEKGTLYEGGIREPLIVRWPGVVDAATTCDEPVTSVDFYPTFLDVSGAAQPHAHILDGVSLVPLLKGGKRLKRKNIYWHYPHYHHSTPAGAVRAGDWKLIEFFEDGRLELYNLRDDIGETRNLAAEQPKRAEKLRKRLAAWRDSLDAAMPVPNPNHDPARATEWGRRPVAKKRGIDAKGQSK